MHDFSILKEIPISVTCDDVDVDDDEHFSEKSVFITSIATVAWPKRNQKSHSILYDSEGKGEMKMKWKIKNKSKNKKAENNSII